MQAPNKGGGGNVRRQFRRGGVGRARQREHLGLGLTSVAWWEKFGNLERTPVQGSTEDDKDILNWQKGAFVMREGWEAI